MPTATNKAAKKRRSELDSLIPFGWDSQAQEYPANLSAFHVPEALEKPKNKAAGAAKRKPAGAPAIDKRTCGVTKGASPSHRTRRGLKEAVDKHTVRRRSSPVKKQRKQQQAEKEKEGEDSTAPVARVAETTTTIRTAAVEEEPATPGHEHGDEGGGTAGAPLPSLRVHPQPAAIQVQLQPSPPPPQPALSSRKVDVTKLLLQRPTLPFALVGSYLAHLVQLPREQRELHEQTVHTLVGEGPGSVACLQSFLESVLNQK